MIAGAHCFSAGSAGFLCSSLSLEPGIDGLGVDARRLLEPCLSDTANPTVGPCQ